MIPRRFALFLLLATCLALLSAGDALPGKHTEKNAAKPASRQPQQREGQEKRPGGRADTRWHKIAPKRQQQLKQAYRNLKGHYSRQALERYKLIKQKHNHPDFNRFPSHWRRFLVKRFRFAQDHIRKLPKAEQERLDKLPHPEKMKAYKDLLTPKFKKEANACKKTVETVFSPFERHCLRRLPPTVRLEILEQSRHNAFNLISHGSWQRFQALGSRKKQVLDYLSIPDALNPEKAGKAAAPPPRL